MRGVLFVHISKEFRSIIDVLPDLYVILKADHPTYTIAAVSNAFIETTHQQGKKLIGQSLFEVFSPDSPEHKRANAILRASFQKVIKNGKPDYIQLQKYDLKRPCGALESRYWRMTTVPYFNDGRLEFIVHTIDDLTEQMLTEERLAETQQRLNDTLAAGSVATWMWDIAEDKVYGDKNYAKFFGVSLEQTLAGLPPATFTRAIHPTDYQTIKQLVDKAVHKTRKFEAEYRIRNPQGEARWVIARGRVEKDEHNKPLRFTGVLVDITARKNAEEAVRQSESQLKFMAESMPQKVFTADKTGKIDYFNPQWIEFTGLSSSDMAGDGWRQIMHPDDLKTLLDKWKRSTKTGEPFEVEARYKAADGAYRWHITRARAMRDEQGVITKWVGSSTDITESKQNQINLDFLARASEVLSSSLDYDTTLAKVAELAVPDIADWCTIDLYSKEHGLKQVALAHKDPAKIKWAHELRKKYPPKFVPDRGVGKVISTGQPEFYSFIPDQLLNKALADANKEQRQILTQLGISAVIIAPLKIRNKTVGAITFVSAEQKRHFTEDDLETAQELAHRAALAMTNAHLYRASQQELAERKRLQEELHRANEELEQRVKERTEEFELTNKNLERSNRELQDFAYVASHDLQEPLRKIQAFGNLLDDEYGEKLGEGRDYLARMRKAALRMSTLIEDLLAFSRVTTRAQPFVEVDIGEVIHEVLSDLETRIQETKGTVKVKKMPHIIADPVQMRQLMQNLIANALKFHRPGIPPVVEITATKDTTKDGTIKAYNIGVSDNGIGFDEKYLDRIFAVFQRLHNRDSYEGTGIGLAVCRKIVERHGGIITATSKVNKGSQFVISIPSHPLRSERE